LGSGAAIAPDAGGAATNIGNKIKQDEEVSIDKNNFPGTGIDRCFVGGLQGQGTRPFYANGGTGSKGAMDLLHAPGDHPGQARHMPYLRDGPGT
jgi:hypothetical protein